MSHPHTLASTPNTLRLAETSFLHPFHHFASKLQENSFKSSPASSTIKHHHPPPLELEIKLLTRSRKLEETKVLALVVHGFQALELSRVFFFTLWASCMSFVCFYMFLETFILYFQNICSSLKFLKVDNGLGFDGFF